MFWTNCSYDFTQNWSIVGEWTLQENVTDSPCPSLGYKTWAELQQLITATDYISHRKGSIRGIQWYWQNSPCHIASLSGSQNAAKYQDCIRSTDPYRGLFCESMLPLVCYKEYSWNQVVLLIQLSVARTIGFHYFLSTYCINQTFKTIISNANILQQIYRSFWEVLTIKTASISANEVLIANPT